jgi:hypothetical protein
MVHRSDKIEIHHGIARSRGGENQGWNLHPLSEYSHAEQHAIDFVLFDSAPDFDFRMKGWSQLPIDLRKAVRKEKSRRMHLNNPSYSCKVLEKKKKTFQDRGTHNFQTPEGRERNRDRAVQRNKQNNLLHNKSPLMRAVTLANNSVRCCCLVCKKECSRPGMGRHLQTHE